MLKAYSYNRCRLFCLHFWLTTQKTEVKKRDQEICQPVNQIATMGT